MIESFWSIPNIENIKVPLTLLKEQAQLLTDNTSGLLYGSVRTISSGDIIHNLLTIHVPNINNYQVEVLDYIQPLEMYPGTIRLLLGGVEEQSIRNYENFESSLRAFLRSTKMSNTLTALLAQARAV